jgi:hypothetical protein
MSADALISRLEKVRPTGRGTWIACCPAHADKSPSLTIRETDDGKVLLHCFAGCTVLEIIDAVGLEMSDLFPPRQHHGRPERRPFPAMDALRAVAFEGLVVNAAATSILAGGPLSSVDRARLLLATSRLQAALSAVAPELRRCHA